MELHKFYNQLSLVLQPPLQIPLIDHHVPALEQVQMLRFSEQDSISDKGEVSVHLVLLDDL